MCLRKVNLMKKAISIILTLLFILGCLSITAGAEPINKGAEGYDVYELQYILKIYGYFTNECTGYFGDATEAAISAFQKDRGISVTGTADDDTFASIREAGCREANVNVKSQLYVREQPSPEAEAIDLLTRNSVVYIYSEKDGWYHIETENGNTGFVLTKYLTAGKFVGIAAKIVSEEGEVNARTSPDLGGTVAFKLPQSAELWVIGGSGDWFKIEYEQQAGYIFKQYVSIGGESGSATSLKELSDAWIASVSASSLKLRTGPSTGYDTITTLSSGTVLSVKGESGDWYYVELANGSKGYVNKNYVKKGTGAKTCTITADGTLNVRKGPGKDYDVVTTLKKGDVVSLLDDSSKWFKIKNVDGKEGYVSSEYVKLGGSLPSNNSSNAPSGTYKQGAEGSNVVTIQKRLKTLGYFTGTATGYYGSATVASVKKFQQNSGLNADGICNSATLTVMFASSAKKASSSSSGTSGGSSSAGEYVPNTNVALGQQIADYAQNFLGVPYKLGANGPNLFDCSGFTKYVYAHFGISIPRTAYEQGYWSKGTKISSKSNLQVGDLVYFNTVDSDSDLCDHAGIYIGNGQVIHASSGSAHKVIISSLSQNYYNTRFSWGRRLI